MTDALVQLIYTALVLAAGSIVLAFVVGAGYSLGAALGREATRPADEGAEEDADIPMDHTNGD